MERKMEPVSIDQAYQINNGQRALTMITVLLSIGKNQSLERLGGSALSTAK
jgi:hypothetical protein